MKLPQLQPPFLPPQVSIYFCLISAPKGLCGSSGVTEGVYSWYVLCGLPSPGLGDSQECRAHASCRSGERLSAGGREGSGKEAWTESCGTGSRGITSGGSAGRQGVRGHEARPGHRSEPKTSECQFPHPNSGNGTVPASQGCLL